MTPDPPAVLSSTSLLRAMRNQIAVVAVGLVLGTVAGFVLASLSQATYMSTTRVLVNPAIGNPYSPTPASVRQDELTSLETEAQMVRSDEVLATVVGDDSTMTIEGVASRIQVVVPPNTQILEISYIDSEPGTAANVVDAIAAAYLANRHARFQDVQDERIARVEKQTARAVADLRAATAAAQIGTPAQRAFNAELASALRNELVSLRSQRSALENSESPAGAIVSPASEPKNAAALTALLLPIGGACVGLVLGCVAAFFIERSRGVIRNSGDSEAAGLPVITSAPARHLLAKGQESRAEAVDTTVRRLRAAILELNPRPKIITVGPADSVTSSADVAEAVAHSFARAGHPVVLLRHEIDTDQATTGDERGLAHALFYESLNVRELLRPSAEPLLSVLVEGGFTAESREFLTADRLRLALKPLTDEGHIVVIEAPAADNTDRDAYLGAADLDVLVLIAAQTRRRDIERMVRVAARHGDDLRALLLGAKDLELLRRPTPGKTHLRDHDTLPGEETRTTK